MAYGLAFQPGAEQNGNNGNGEKRASAAPVQEAVRLLSLRLPSVVGARALAPQTLLQSPGSAGLTGPGGMSVDAMIEWLRRQIQQSGAAVPAQASGIFDAPSEGGGGGGSSEGGSQPPTSTALPQPERQRPQLEIESSPRFPTRITPGQETGEGPGRGGFEVPAPFIDPRPVLPASPTMSADPWEERSHDSWIPDDRGDDYWRG
jgi:hypothetical protein